MSIVSGTLGAVLSADAAGEANATNKAIADQQARASLKMFKESRKFVSVKHFKGGEKLLSLSAKRGIRALEGQQGGIRGQLRAQRAAVDAYRPLLAAADKTATGIFDRSLTNEALGYLQPVLQSRLAQAEVAAQGSEQALQEQLAFQRAQAAQKGFVGDTSREQMLQFEARRQAATEAAKARAAAGMANAQDTYLINQADINQRVANVGLPGQMVNQGLGINNAAEAQLVQNMRGRASLMDPFKISPGTPPYPQPFQVQPVPGAGALAAQGLSAAGQQLGNYYLYKNLYSQAGANPNLAASYGFGQQTGAGWNSLGGAGGGAAAYGSTPAANYDWAASMAPAGAG